MGQFVVHTLETAPDASRDVLRAVHQRFGFVPNLLGELADAPAALQAYVSLGDLLGRSSLTPLEQQVVLVAASVANTCDYCVAAHTAGLKTAGLDAAQLDAVRSGRPLADPRLEAIRAFTAAVVASRGRPGEAELQRFLDSGRTRAQALEVLVGVAMKTLSNYTNHLAETPLDRQFEPFAWTAAA